MSRMILRGFGWTMIWVLCLIGALISWFWMGAGLIARSRRGHVLAVAFDQLVNAAIGGDPDETISSRAARGRDRGEWNWCLLCRVLDWIDPDHCNKSRGT